MNQSLRFNPSPVFLITLTFLVACGQNTTNQRILVTAIQREEFPSWSPDGQAIVFESDVGCPEHVYKVGIGGGGLTQLTGASGDGGGPSWKPVR